MPRYWSKNSQREVHESFKTLGFLEMFGLWREVAASPLPPFKDHEPPKQSKVHGLPVLVGSTFQEAPERSWGCVVTENSIKTKWLHVFPASPRHVSSD